MAKKHSKVKVVTTSAAFLGLVTPAAVAAQDVPETTENSKEAATETEAAKTVSASGTVKETAANTAEKQESSNQTQTQSEGKSSTDKAGSDCAEAAPVQKDGKQENTGGTDSTQPKAETNQKAEEVTDNSKHSPENAGSTEKTNKKEEQPVNSKSVQTEQTDTNSDKGSAEKQPADSNAAKTGNQETDKAADKDQGKTEAGNGSITITDHVTVVTEKDNKENQPEATGADKNNNKKNEVVTDKTIDLNIAGKGETEDVILNTEKTWSYFGIDELIAENQAKVNEHSKGQNTANVTAPKQFIDSLISFANDKEKAENKGAGIIEEKAEIQYNFLSDTGGQLVKAEVPGSFLQERIEKLVTERPVKTETVYQTGDITFRVVPTEAGEQKVQILVQGQPLVATDRYTVSLKEDIGQIIGEQTGNLGLPTETNGGGLQPVVINGVQPGIVFAQPQVPETQLGLITHVTENGITPIDQLITAPAETGSDTTLIINEQPVPVENDRFTDVIDVQSELPETTIIVNQGTGTPAETVETETPQFITETNWTEQPTETEEYVAAGPLANGGGATGKGEWSAQNETGQQEVKGVSVEKTSSPWTPANSESKAEGNSTVEQASTLPQTSENRFILFAMGLAMLAAGGVFRFRKKEPMA